MAFQVIPSPDNAGVLATEAFTKFTLLGKQLQQAKDEHELAQANLQQATLQTRLLGQYGPQEAEARIAASQADIRRSDATTSLEQNREKRLDAQAPLQTQLLGQEVQKNALALSEEKQLSPIRVSSAGLNLNYQAGALSRQGLENTGLGLENTSRDQQNQIGEFSLREQKGAQALAKHIATTELNLDPYTANLVSGPMHLDMISKARAGEVQLHQTRALTAATEAETLERSNLAPVHKAEMLSGIARNLDSIDPAALDWVASQASPGAQNILTGLRTLGSSTSKNTTQLMSRGFRIGTPESMAAALDVQEGIKNLGDKGGQFFNLQTNKMETRPSGIDRLKESTARLAKIVGQPLEPNKAQPNQESEPVIDGLEPINARKAAGAISARISATNDRALSYSKDVGPIATKTTREDVVNNQLPNEVLTDVQGNVPAAKAERVKKVFDSLTPVDGGDKPALQSRGRVLEMMRQAVQTGRPQLVIDTVGKKYGPTYGLNEEDIANWNAFEASMGWKLVNFVMPVAAK